MLSLFIYGAASGVGCHTQVYLVDPPVVVPGLSCCRHTGLAGLRHVRSRDPRPGIGRTCVPCVAGRFLTAGPPGSSSAFSTHEEILDCFPKGRVKLEAAVRVWRQNWRLGAREGVCVTEYSGRENNIWTSSLRAELGFVGFSSVFFMPRVVLGT